MTKYAPLGEYLRALPATVDDHTLSFLEIERILGFSLPRSAHDHPAWWSNPSSPVDHPHAQAWLRAGWEVDSFSMRAQWVRFRRK